MKSSDELRRAIGDELARAREASKMTQVELATKADVHRTYVSQLEHGQKFPTLDVFFRLCTAMEVSPSKLIARIEMGQ